MFTAKIHFVQDGDLDLIKDASVKIAAHGQYMWAIRVDKRYQS